MRVDVWSMCGIMRLSSAEIVCAEIMCVICVMISV